MNFIIKKISLLASCPMLLAADGARGGYISATSNVVLYRFDNTKDYTLPIMFSGGKGETLKVNARLYNNKTNALVYSKNYTTTLEPKTNCEY